MSKLAPILLLDFDSTLTTTSTLPSLLSIPTTVYASKPHTTCGRPDSLVSLASAYLTSLQTHASRYVPQATQRTTLSQEIAYQNSLRPIEEASFSKGQDAFRIAGVTSTDVCKAARDALSDGSVEFRKGWVNLFRRYYANNREQVKSIGIISMTWSPIWLSTLVHRAGLKDGLIVPGNRLVGIGDENTAFCCDVYANDALDVEGNRVGVYVSADKMRIMHQVVDNVKTTTLTEEAHEHPNDSTLIASKARRSIKPNPPIIYIGDSLTDLECLLAADVGIIIRDDNTMGNEQCELKETLERIGVSVVWIGGVKTAQHGCNIAAKTTQQLWWATDFDEIVASGLLDLMRH